MRLACPLFLFLTDLALLACDRSPTCPCQITQPHPVLAVYQSLSVNTVANLGRRLGVSWSVSLGTRPGLAASVFASNASTAGFPRMQRLGEGAYQFYNPAACPFSGAVSVIVTRVLLIDTGWSGGRAGNPCRRAVPVQPRRTVPLSHS